MKQLNNTKSIFKIVQLAECLLWMKLSCDPICLHDAIFSDLMESRKIKTRFTSRILPIQNTCHAGFEEIKEMTRILAKNLLNDSNGQGIKYAVVPKTRNNVNF